MKIRKAELVIFAVLIIAAIAAWIIMSRNRKLTDHGSIRITVDGKLYGEYELNKDQKIHINDTNTCRIRNGMVRMIEATCPDHLCLHQDEVGERGGLIICLPNKVVIEGIPSAEASTSADLPDTVAQ